MKPFAQLFAVLFAVGFVLAYWWIIMLGVAVVLAVKLAPIAYHRYQAAVAAEQTRLAAIAARADQQHAWVLAGDDRGVYGAYPPAHGQRLCVVDVYPALDSPPAYWNPAIFTNESTSESGSWTTQLVAWNGR
jgi:hypothetical protein